MNLATQVILMGAPSSSGANAAGLERSPNHLRHCGLLFELIKNGMSVDDAGDAEVRRYRCDRENITARNLARVVDCARDVRDRAATIQISNGRLVLIGGDCTVTAGLVAALTQRVPKLGLVYVDSQTDLNTPAETTTGILDSMGLAHMLGVVDNSLARLGSTFPLVDPERVVAFGFHPERINEVEHRLLSELRVAVYPATEVTGKASYYAEHARSRIERSCDGYVVHFDVDVIDFTAFPVADAPVYRGFGLEFEESIAAVGALCASPKCLGLSITEFNPDRDEDGTLGRQFVQALARALSAFGRGAQVT